MWALILAFSLTSHGFLSKPVHHSTINQYKVISIIQLCQILDKITQIKRLKQCSEIISFLCSHATPISFLFLQLLILCEFLCYSTYRFGLHYHGLCVWVCVCVCVCVCVRWCLRQQSQFTLASQLTSEVMPKNLAQRGQTETVMAKSNSFHRQRNWIERRKV